MRRIVFMILAGWLTFSALASPAVAQENTPQTEGSSVSRQFDHFVSKGGAITWFILIPMSIATVALVVEHFLSIRRDKVIPATTVQRIRTDLEAKRYVDAIQFTSGDPSPLAGAVNAGLVQGANGYSAMQRAVADAVEQSTARMMRKIEYLNVIGNVSPMIGLFGTVYGMIGLFASISEAGGIPEPAIIADNISVALVTTFWGLMVAIPALSAFAFFRNRIDELAMTCAVTADKLLASFESASGETSPRPATAAASVSTPFATPAGSTT